MMVVAFGTHRAPPPFAVHRREMPPPVPKTLLKPSILLPSRRYHHRRTHNPSPPPPSLANLHHTSRSRIVSSGFLSQLARQRRSGWSPGPWGCVPWEERRCAAGPRAGADGAGVDLLWRTVTDPAQRGQGEEGNDDGGDKEEEEEGLVTLPTVLTLGRVAAVPLIVSTFFMDGWWASTATTGIFVAAAITDWLDGYIARKMQLRTTFGAFLDPVADKLMVATTLILLCSKPLVVDVFGVPWLLTVPSIVIIGREITMSAVREWAASQDSKVLESVAVSRMGKLKTATQMTALTILLASRDPSLSASSILAPSGVVLLYVSAGLALWSLVVYMRKIWRILLK